MADRNAMLCARGAKHGVELSAEDEARIVAAHVAADALEAEAKIARQIASTLRVNLVNANRAKIRAERKGEILAKLDERRAELVRQLAELDAKVAVAS
jgi:uncharacterized protein (DUF58 family)